MAHRYSVGQRVKYMYIAAINHDPPRIHEGTAKIIAIVPDSGDDEPSKYQVYDSYLDYTSIIVDGQIKEVLEQDATSGEA